MGDVWSFESVTEARRHPLIQWGDPVMKDCGDVFHQYTLHEFPRFLARFVSTSLIERVTDTTKRLESQGIVKRIIADKLYDEFGQDIWTALVSAAREVPADPDVVIDLVQSDRDKILKETTVAKKETNTPAAGEAGAAKPEKPVKEKAPQLVRGHAMTATVTFGTDKDGKQYGPKHNPKREGSASAARFGLYKAGKTLADQLKIEGGPTLDDLKFDSDPKRNLIVITD